MDRVTESDRYKWLVLGFSTVASMQFTANILNVPTILDALSRDLRLDYATQGILLSAPVLAVAVSAFLGGILTDRIGIRYATGAGIFLVGAGGALRGSAPNFPFLLAFTLVVGLGYGLSLPNMAKMVSGRFSGKFSGRASGIYTSGLSAGAILGLLLSPTISSIAGGWRGVFFIWGGATLVTAVIWVGLIRDPEELRGTPYISVSLSALRTILSSRGLLSLTALFFAANALFYIETGWLKEFFDWRWGEPSTSILLVSALALLFVPSNLINPIFSDRIGLRRPFLVAAGVASSFAGIMIGTSSQTAVLPTTILGATVSAEFVICLTIPAELVEHKFVGAASGFMISVGYLGGVLGPFVVGVLRQDTGNFVFFPALVSIISAVSVLLALILPETGWKAKAGSQVQKGQARVHISATRHCWP